LLDYQKNIYDYINSFDLMVSASLWEGIPYVILEAMALGKPVIAFSSKLSGVREMIEDGESGFLITENYVNALFFKIGELYNNREKLSCVSDGSRKMIGNKFTETAMVSKTDQLYKQLFH
jgi:glycosyltransferase involved in cell wall biosynthesis